MSYQKQNFANGEVLTASQLNHIEQGIVDVESTAEAAKATVDKIIDPTLSLSGKAADAKATGDALATKAVIDDTTVGTDAWSSKHIIDTLCPPLEETGNPVVCYPVASYPLGVKASWEPTQEGSGEPSPDNIRPISGRESISMERCGGNVIEFLNTYDSSSGIKIAVDAEKNITLNGTTAEKNNITIGMCRLHWVAGKTYTMYVKKVSGSASLGSGDGITFAYSLFTTDYNHHFRGDTNSTNLDAYIARDVALVETELIFMLQCWRVGTVFNNFKFQIEVVPGTTPPTTYSPYIGQTSALTLPRTIYGGTVDAVTGDGQETCALVTLDGTEKVNVNDSSNKASTFILNFDAPAKPFNGTPAALWMVSSHFIKATTLYFDAAVPNTIWYNDTGTQMRIAWNSGNNHATIDEFKAFLTAQYAAGTPVQIAYKLAKPVPILATGAQPIPALNGVNTLLTDADSATVTGRADPIKRITDLEDAVASMTTT